MCLPKPCSTLLAAASNAAIGVWCATSLSGEYKLFCLAFFVPAACSLVLCTTRRGACPHRLAGSLLLLLAALKAIAALALAALALSAGQADTMLGALGALAYGVLAGLLGLSALPDLCAGGPAACARARGDRILNVEAVEANLTDF